MPVMYRPVEKAKPGDAGAAKKFYAAIVRGRKIDLRSFVEEIAEANTLQTTDVLAVLESFLKSCTKHLLQGRSIELGQLGMFSPSLQSNGEVTAEEVDRNTIKQIKVNFRSSTLLKKQLSIADFEKVD